MARLVSSHPQTSANSFALRPLILQQHQTCPQKHLASPFYSSISNLALNYAHTPSSLPSSHASRSRLRAAKHASAFRPRTEDRKTLLTEAFGSEVAEAFDQNLDEYQKLHFEAYKVKVASQRTNFLERSKIAAKVPSFWARSLQNCRQVAELIDAVDEDVFNHLSDVWIQHDDKDPRNWEITLTFDAKNPFFSNKTLTKKFSIEHPSSTTPAKPYDLEAPLYLLAPSKEDAIKWTSDEHNLVKKAPRPNLEDLEEFDEFDGAGSFFNLFSEDGEDKMGVGEALLEWFAHATEYAAGLSFLFENNDDELDEFDQGELDDEDDDDEDDPEDLNAEIDLEQEEEDKSRPKKRSKKN